MASIIDRAVRAGRARVQYDTLKILNAQNVQVSQGGQMERPDFKARGAKRPAWLSGGSSDLPPGQAPVEGFPRFGWLWQPRGALPQAKPTIRVCGLVDEPFDFPVSALRKMKRRQLTADF